MRHQRDNCHLTSVLVPMHAGFHHFCLGETSVLMMSRGLCSCWAKTRMPYVQQFAWNKGLCKYECIWFKYLHLEASFFWDRASCSSSWPLMRCIVKDDLELLILLLFPPNCWNCRCVPPQLVPLVVGYLTQYFIHARQSLYQLSPGPGCFLKRLGGESKILYL